MFELLEGVEEVEGLEDEDSGGVGDEDDVGVGDRDDVGVGEEDDDGALVTFSSLTALAGWGGPHWSRLDPSSRRRQHVCVYQDCQW